MSDIFLVKISKILQNPQKSQISLLKINPLYGRLLVRLLFRLKYRKRVLQTPTVTILKGFWVWSCTPTHPRTRTHTHTHAQTFIINMIHTAQDTNILIFGSHKSQVGIFSSLHWSIIISFIIISVATSVTLPLWSRLPLRLTC